MAAGLVVIVGAALLAGARVFGARAGEGPGPLPSTSPAAVAAPGVFGVPTVTSGCAAASVRAAAARCPKAPECWNGLVEISGSVTAGSLPCTSPHIWETFAIAILPSDVRTYDQSLVAANRSVRAVCSVPVLLASRQGLARLIPPRGWEIQVLPPDEASFDSGARAYRCLAHRLRGASARTSDFAR